MKILTANQLDTGRVIYWGPEGRAVSAIDEALSLEADTAEQALAAALGQPRLFVNPYLIEVEATTPVGRDRLKERIRSAGPTVGHSLNPALRAKVA